jgi:uncharacterized protein (TIGR01777 family)
MKIFMTGGTGFVGTFLSRQLVTNGHSVTILAQSKPSAKKNLKGIGYIEGLSTQKGEWQKSVPEHDAVINLAGASIFSRWTQKQKQLILSSRINTTRNIVDALPDNADHFTIISASAVGYYGFTGNEELSESAPVGSDFLAQLAFKWEQEAIGAKSKGARVIATRFGIVLGKTGGAIGMMLPLFKYGLGGPLGSGAQWFSWIHIHDLANAILFLLEKKDLEGPFNLCAPNPVSNKELARAIGRILRRPSFFTAPGFMIRLFLGEFGLVLLKGQRVLPTRLLEHGFRFKHPELEAALKDILL